MFKEWRNNKKYFQNLKFYMCLLDEGTVKMWEKTRWLFELGTIHKLCRLGSGGGGGVQKCRFSDDIVYGRPLTVR